MRSAAPIYMQSTLRSGGLPIDDHVEGYNIFQGKIGLYHTSISQWLAYRLIPCGISTPALCSKDEIGLSTVEGLTMPKGVLEKVSTFMKSQPLKGFLHL